VIVDGTDNFPTRYLVNDAALIKNIRSCTVRSFASKGRSPSLTRTSDRATACMIPEPPPPELAPSCAEAGVLGVLPGIVGSIQAIETIKLLLELGDPLVGRLLTYDSMDESFEPLRFDAIRRAGVR